MLVGGASRLGGFFFCVVGLVCYGLGMAIDVVSNFVPVRVGGRVVRGLPAGVGPVRVVVDSVRAGSVRGALRSYGESGVVPHFTVDFGGSGDCASVVRHLGLDECGVGLCGGPLESHLVGRTVWVMVLRPAGLVPGEVESFWLGGVVGAIAGAVGANSFWEPFVGDGEVGLRSSEMSFGVWREFSGVCGASRVPFCDRFGPGSFDLSAFGDGLVGSSAWVVEDVGGVVVEAGGLDVSVGVGVPDVSVSSGLGVFPGRRVKLGSGGKAVGMLREAFGLGPGRFDEELHELVVGVQVDAGLTPDGVVDRGVWEAVAERV